MVPGLYEDEEFLSFLDACSEALELVRADIRSLQGLYAPQKAPAHVLDHLLANLGWSRPWFATEEVKRKLARYLRRLLARRGTLRGIADMIRLVTGLECVVRNRPRREGTGYPWPAGSREWYTIEIVPPRELSSEEAEAVGRCVDYMRPAHAYWRILPPIEHWELGVSELGVETQLHGVSVDHWELGVSDLGAETLLH